MLRGKVFLRFELHMCALSRRSEIGHLRVVGAVGRVRKAAASATYPKMLPKLLRATCMVGEILPLRIANAQRTRNARCASSAFGGGLISR